MPQATASLVRDLVFIVFKRKVPLLGLLLVGTAILLYGAATGEPEYEASARVFVKRQPAGYQMPAESQHVLRRIEVVNSEIQIVTSAAVAAEVVDRVGLASAEDRALVVERLQKRIKAESPTESDIINIRYRHKDPEMAARVVNAVLDAYLDIRRSVAYNAEAADFLNHQAGVVKAELDSIADEIAKLGGEKWQLTVGRKPEQQMGLGDRLLNELITLDTRISSRERELAMVREWLDTTDASHVPTYNTYEMPTVIDAKRKLLEIQEELAEARSKYTADHPEVRRLERQAALAADVLRAEVEQAHMRQSAQVQEWKAQRRSAFDKYLELQAQNSEIAENDMRLRILEHELSIRADLYAVIMDRREQYRITAATDPGLMNVGIVSRAAVPVEPAAQAVNMRFVFGLFTIFFGFMLVMALERMDHTLERPEDVERTLGIKVLAWIPEREA
ncbi:MAG: hypothetical protein FJY74_02530 [Candidatus Eisenbacteria bacterium]|nr:hypothetical protein [Candidatus Eisenbacteria bacterium]